MAVIGTADYPSGRINFGLFSEKIALNQNSDEIPTDPESIASKPESEGFATGRQLMRKHVKKLLNRHNDFKTKGLLCPKHGMFDPISIPETTLLPMDDLLEKYLLDCIVQLRQVYQCLQCRSLLTKVGGLRSIHEDFMQVKSLFSYKENQNWSRMSNTSQDSIENLANIRQSTDLFQNPPSLDLRLHPGCVDRGSKPVDKSEYCWKWLLCSANDSSRSPKMMKRSRVPDSTSLLSVDTKITNLSHSSSCATDSSGNHSPTGFHSPTVNEGGNFRTEPLTDSDAMFPYHVARKHERIGNAKAQYGWWSQDANKTTNLIDIDRRHDRIQYGFRRTPWYATSTEAKFDQQLWPALSTMNLYPFTEENKMQQNTRTLDYLSSISPMMDVIPPPNHNPFAKNESI